MKNMVIFVILKNLVMLMAMAAVVEMLLLIAIHWCDDVGGDFDDEPGDCDAYSATWFAYCVCQYFVFEMMTIATRAVWCD